jgi:hypothetical protein
MSNASDDNWKQFQGTELGSLLSGIYGNKPKIVYPKLNRVSSGSTIENREGWRPTINKPTAVDPRKTTRRPIDLIVPKMKGGKSHKSLALIDCIPRRKNENVI